MIWFMTFKLLFKTLISAKPLRIRFNKVDGLIRVYDGTRCLVFRSIYLAFRTFC